jgi:hypothetical protein
MFGWFRKKKTAPSDAQGSVEGPTGRDGEELARAVAVGREFETRGAVAEPQLRAFIEEYPASYHLMRVYLAGLLADRHEFDEATEHARIYLRSIRDAGGLANMRRLPATQVGATRAFLLLTAVYTEAGARSYSIRVLNHAMDFPLSRTEEISGEIQNLEQELKQPALKEVDSRWEAMFNRGDGASELCELCDSKGFPALADRVDLIASNHAYGSAATVNDPKKELFLMVKEVKIGSDTAKALV